MKLGRIQRRHRRRFEKLDLIAERIREMATRGRMVVELDLPREIEYPLQSGQALPRRPRIFYAKVDEAPRIDDIPWCTTLVVSHKVRDIMMDIDGRHLRSYPVRLDRSVGVSYCVIHCQRILTCHDRTKVKYHSNSVRDLFVIDPTRVPKNAHIFHPRYYKTWFLVSDVVKAALLDAKCTGGVFYRSNQDGS